MQFTLKYTHNGKTIKEACANLYDVQIALYQLKNEKDIDPHNVSVIITSEHPGDEVMALRQDLSHAQRTGAPLRRLTDLWRPWVPDKLH